jgi:NAD(P)-dependent dehydrogenase (short-subunit alcohol dehydrogenase family)
MAGGSIVITGASTGIGEACALALDRLGFRVFAGVRRFADGEALKAKGSGRLTPVSLDVTSLESIHSAVKLVGPGPIAGLVNNAGIVVSGPIELVPLELWRNQLEVNVLGPVAVTQAFLPAIRLGRGRIVNIGSIAGRSALPLAGPYSASKFALEAISDSLRMEVKSWGIEVSVIEPGAVRTSIWRKTFSQVEEQLRQIPKEKYELYRDIIEKMQAGARMAERSAVPVEEVVKAVEHALTSNKPKSRYPVGRDAKLRLLLNHLPDLTRDRLILKKLKSLRIDYLR